MDNFGLADILSQIGRLSAKLDRLREDVKEASAKMDDLRREVTFVKNVVYVIGATIIIAICNL